MNIGNVRESFQVFMKAEDEKKKESKKKFKYSNVEIENEGSAIILPKGMTKEEGVECIKRRIQEDETEIRVSEEVNAFPLDGAFALMNVLKGIFGWAQPVPTRGFFGDTPPTMLSLQIGPNEWTQVIWGEFVIPGVEGRLKTGATQRDGRWVFAISGVVKKRYQKIIGEIAQCVREYIKTNSIYKSKAIKIRTNDDGDIDVQNPPTFLDTAGATPESLIFSDQTMADIRANIFTPIEKKDMCLKMGIPVKRSILLEGPFGTGKTLTANVSANLAEQNGWTFIYLDRVSGLKQALIFARQYGPAVVFAEDIDRVVSGERDMEMDDILNTIDGIDSKRDETLVILTSNDVMSIERAMLRPGRLDAVIHVGPPDRVAAEKLIRYYAGDLLPKKESLEEAGDELAGQIPATISEVVKKAKLYQLALGNSEKLTGKAIADAARAMKRHLELLNREDKTILTPEQQIGHSMAQIVKDTMSAYPLLNGAGNEIREKVQEIHERVC